MLRLTHKDAWMPPGILELRCDNEASSVVVRLRLDNDEQAAKFPPDSRAVLMEEVAAWLQFAAVAVGRTPDGAPLRSWAWTMAARVADSCTPTPQQE
ncbi:MAG TPA: hypothetical protein VFL14_14890 [Xanthomonadales bacterium]|nr:hypothetical protein [Xanthomonadales bacterium]